jgi:hypothetical protein
MSFEAKRLRVQLPCGEATVQELQAGPQCGVSCRFPTQVCEGGTCWFETPPICQFDTCGIVTPVTCYHFASPVTCYHFRTCYHFTWPPCGPSPVCHRFVSCTPRTDLELDPGTIVVDPEDLPRLREQLEAQLKEIEKAEAELEKRKE